MRASDSASVVTAQRFLGVMLFLGLWWGSAAGWAQSLPASLQTAWQKTGLPESALSLVVQELEGPELISIDPYTPSNQASVRSVVTTLDGLLGLRPDSRCLA